MPAPPKKTSGRLKDFLKQTLRAHANGAATGAAMATLFIVLGGFITSFTHLVVFGTWEWLHGQAMLAIGLPAFLTGWFFSLAVPLLIRRKRNFVLGAVLTALGAAVLHRLIFVSRALTWQNDSVDVLGELEQNVYACVSVFGQTQWCVMKESARLDFFAWDWSLGAELGAVATAGALAFFLYGRYWDRMAKRHIAKARHPRG